MNRFEYEGFVIQEEKARSSAREGYEPNALGFLTSHGGRGGDGHTVRRGQRPGFGPLRSLKFSSTMLVRARSQSRPSRGGLIWTSASVGIGSGSEDGLVARRITSSLVDWLQKGFTSHEPLPTGP